MALFVNVPKPLGASGGNDLEKRIEAIENILTSLIDEINFSITHLGAENVLEATTALNALNIDAKNINTDNQKITSDQIESILATKIVDADGNPLIRFKPTSGTAVFNGELED